MPASNTLFSWNTEGFLSTDTQRREMYQGGTRNQNVTPIALVGSQHQHNVLMVSRRQFASYPIFLISAVFIFLCILSENSLLHASEWDPIPLNSLPRLPNQEDYAEIYLLQAPLLKWKLGDVLGSLGMVHGAVGIKTQSSDPSCNLFFSLEYDGIPNMFGAIFPSIDEGGNITWHNVGASILYAPVNESYYSVGVTHVGTVSSSLYNNFLDQYIAGVNDTYPFYQMVNVVGENDNVYFNSFDCFDLVYDAFDWLIQRGMQLQPDAKTQKCWTNLVCADAPLLIENPEERHEEILRFFKLIELKTKDMTMVEAIAALSEILSQKHFFLRIKDQYYELTLQNPYWELKYESYPVKEALVRYRSKKASYMAQEMRSPNLRIETPR